MPPSKDKQRKACPRRVNIYTHYDLNFPNIHIRRNTHFERVHLIIYIKESDVGDIKITHANVSVALPLYEDSNLRDLILQTGNVRKRPFETGPTNGLVSLSIDVVYLRPPTRGQALSGAKINNIFEITNIFQKKLHLR